MHMFRNLFKIIKKKRLLKIIKKAKKVFLSGERTCMCPCFMDVMNNVTTYLDIVKIIPEFNPSTFDLNSSPHVIWWAPDDRESRIKAFNKLIEIYSK